MAIPAFEKYLLPMLNIYKSGYKIPIKDIRDSLSKEFGLSQLDLEEMTLGGNAYKHNDRVYWARTYLSKSGLLEGAKGVYSITQDGLKLLNKKLTTLTRKDLEKYDGFLEFKNKKKLTSNETILSTDIHESDPKETLLASLSEINEALALDVLDAVKEQSDKFFERLVVKLLVAMGYGGKFSNSVEVVGRSGDGGIDGIINQDALGLDKIYIQAKKYTENSVGASDLRDFVGALTFKGGGKGVFFTTSRFSKKTAEEIKSKAPHIVLIDGVELSKLMIQYKIGVTEEKILSLCKLDIDFFEE